MKFSITILRGCACMLTCHRTWIIYTYRSGSGVNNGGHRFPNDRSTIVFLGTQGNKGSIESARVRCERGLYVSVDVHS